MVCPLGSSLTRFLLVDGSFLAFSLCTVTQPGILTIGVPAVTVTGTAIGIASGGFANQLRVSRTLTFLISETNTLRIPIFCSLIKGIPVPFTPILGIL